MVKEVGNGNWAEEESRPFISIEDDAVVKVRLMNWMERAIVLVK